MPPMSQLMKGAARKGKSAENEDSKFASTATMTIVGVENVAETSPEMQKSTPKKTAAKKNSMEKPPMPRTPRTRALPQPKEVDVSVTISVGSDDISIELLGKVEEFLQKECISGLCSIEQGGALSRLHLQMVCRLLATSPAMVSKRIKVYLGWDDAKKAPVGHHILTKTLRNTGLHTFIGMLGYCIKDKGEEHFQCVHKNVTTEQIEEGVEEYIKHGTPFAKNRTVLTHTNLIERAATYCKYKLKKQLGSTLPGTLLPMLRSGQYIPSASWVLPVRQGGMEYNRAAALWKCMMNPDAVDMDDVTQIFFEHTNPGSRLANLGRQRLAANLEEAREGAEHDYVVLDNVPEESQRHRNDVIVIDDTQDVDTCNANLARTTADKGLQTVAAPMYILVVFGDRDLHNNLLL